MTYYFLESSALAKLFILEDGSEPLVRLMERVDDINKLVSSLASLEVRSAIRGRQRAGEIQSSDAEYALDCLAAESLRMVEQPVNPLVVETAHLVLDQHPLRALDALHLATCLVARDTLRATDICFVSADTLLLQAADCERLQTMNPLKL